MRWIVSAFTALLCLLPAAGSAANDPAAARQLLESMSPAEQQALLRDFRGGLSISSGLQRQGSAEQGQAGNPPEVVRPQQSAELLDDGELRPFGYDLFDPAAGRLLPANDIPVPDNYIIGPADMVVLQLYGKENGSYELEVSRDGTVAVPQIGPVPVAGLSLAQMRERLAQRIDDQMIGVQSSITMGPLRSMQVFVLGDVRQPGSYTVSALATITHALYVSGGIAKTGSMRRLQLKRRGRVAARLDLYDLLLKGDTRRDIRLRPGDVIFVPPVGETVSVSGEVRRPGIYEIVQASTAGKLLELAGGALPGAYQPNLRVLRFIEGRDRVALNIDLASASQFPVRNGDSLGLLAVLDDVVGGVSISGHYRREGDFAWRQGMRLSDLLGDVDAFKPLPDLDYAVIIREAPRSRRLHVLNVNPAAALAGRGGASDPLLQPQDEVLVFGLQETERSAKITARRQQLLEAETEAGQAALFEEQERDDEGEEQEPKLQAAVDEGQFRPGRPALRDLLRRLHAQARYGQPTRVVEAIGQLRFPGHYPLSNNMRVSDLLRAAGRLGESAYAVEAEITRHVSTADGYQQVEHLPVRLADVLSGVAGADIELLAHDVLTIKRVPNWQELAFVEISGEVRFPGRYPLQRGETLKMLMERAGGLRDLAYPEGSVFTREGLKAKEAQRLEELAERLEADLTSITLDRLQQDKDAEGALSLAQALLKRLRNTEPAGRLVIDLPNILANNGAVRPLILEPGDKLFVPPILQEVTVVGEVQYSTSHVYRDGLTRRDYVDFSGGYTERADRGRVYVIRANGEVVISRGGRWFGGNNVEIQPGDTIVAPLNADRIQPLLLLTSVSQILYQLALAVAGFNAVGAF